MGPGEGVGLGVQGGCERRSFCENSKKKFGGGAGCRRQGSGGGGGGQGGCERIIEVFVEI